MQNEKCTGYPKEALDAMEESDLWFEILNKWPLSRQKSIYETLKEDCLIAIELKKIIEEEERKLEIPPHHDDDRRHINNELIRLALEENPKLTSIFNRPSKKES